MTLDAALIPNLPGALCQETDPELFFSESGGPIHPAVQVCHRCPVEHACLLWALEKRERFGIWGGMWAHHRTRLLTRLDREGITPADWQRTEAEAEVRAATSLAAARAARRAQQEELWAREAAEQLAAEQEAARAAERAAEQEQRATIIRETVTAFWDAANA
ncbi:WhiB family transcriptional regulator [uncultured Friedmanniella sp.]|uniref:WhiB family transcriptional regulator n=1 Tax=uncultured Friedmanniella sp. TaxID=335381 RepID=UPI0035CA964C